MIMQEEQIREALKKPGRRRRPAMQTRNTIFTTKMPFVTILSQGRPAYTVSIMEFRNGKVVHETQYFADPFEAPAWRSQWVQRMPH